MKNKIKVALLSGLLLVTASCNDYFDTVPGERMTLESVFQSKELTEKFLANVYSYIPDEHNQRQGGSTVGVWTAASSEAEFTWSGVNSNEVNNGAVNATSGWVNRWWIEYYKGIAKAGIFMENVNKNPELTDELKVQYYNEARALRAIYYFWIFKIYGPFVILDKVYPADATNEEMNLPRNSVDECISFIDSELAAVRSNLNVAHSGGEFTPILVGHINRDIVDAVRSQLWLYAASPLFNGNSFYRSLVNADGKQLFPQTEDNTKWEKARNYAGDFLKTYTNYKLVTLDANGEAVTDMKKVDPYNSVRSAVYWESVTPNSEMILYRKDGSHSVFYYDMTPYHKGASGSYKGGTGKDATQEMVDLYFMKDGRRIDDWIADGTYPDYPLNTDLGDDIYDYLKYGEGYNDPITGRTYIAARTGKDVLAQYYDREARFYADITFNNQKWLATDATIYTGLARDGNSGMDAASNDYSRTGYVVRKAATSKAWTAAEGNIILIRLPEIYLNYAEALAECQNRGIAPQASSGVSDQYQTAIDYVNMIRARAGIPGYSFTAGTTDARGLTCIQIDKDYTSIMNVIRRERTIELAFDNQRYFDVRRWKVAGMAQGDGWVYPTYHRGGEGGDTYGLSYDRAEYDGFYIKKPFETRSYSERMNLFPIPQADINRNPLMRQNTGWMSE